MQNVTLLSRTTAIGYYHQNMVGLAEKLTDHLATPPEGAPRQRLWRVRAGQVVLAQGALERPLVFDDNDRPGVMLAGAAQTYLNRYGVKVGNRASSSPRTTAPGTPHSIWPTPGVTVAAIVDIRADVTRELPRAAKAHGIETLLGHTVTGTKGRLRVIVGPRQPRPRRQRGRCAQRSPATRC